MKKNNIIILNCIFLIVCSCHDGGGSLNMTVNHDPVISSGDHHFNEQESQSKNIDEGPILERMSELSKDALWLFTMPKSGTTYTINFLNNYFSLLIEDRDEELSQDVFFKVLGRHDRFEKNTIEEIRQDQKKLLESTDFKFFLFTHYCIPSYAKKTLMLTRNPLDNIVSKFFYEYKNRGGEQSLFERWRYEADVFISVYKSQQSVLEKNEDSMLIHYEELITYPKITFTKIINFLEVEYNEYALEKAIEFSSKKSLKKLEKEAKNSNNKDQYHYKLNSFVRSGEIGDWKKHINNELAGEILSYLQMNGVSNRDIKSYQYE